MISIKGVGVYIMCGSRGIFNEGHAHPCGDERRHQHREVFVVFFLQKCCYVWASLLASQFEEQQFRLTPTMIPRNFRAALVALKKCSAAAPHGTVMFM